MKTLAGRHRRRPARTGLRPRAEALESRLAPATLMVTNTNDSGLGSLRQALSDATAGTTIAFNIPGLGVHRIAPTTPLPFVTATVTIDGTTQPGYTGTPLIEIDGASAGTNPDGSAADGLRIQASSVTVAGLDVDDFPGRGVSIQNGGDDAVRACYIGLDPTGTTAKPNGAEGVYITNSSNDAIGGPNAADRNVISGNKGDGVHVLFVGGPANNTLFQNNYIGTDASGTERLSNGGAGINIFATSAFDRILDNLISGNSSSGITFFSDGPSDALIQGNLIGTDKDGVGPIGNGGSGIDDGGAPRTKIVDNVISGNNGSGVNLTFSSTVGSVVQGNLIGVAKDGVHALGNLDRGLITNFSASNALIGGPNPGDGNVIAFNGKTFSGAGVEVDSGSTGIAVEGNSIYGNYGLGIDLNGDGVTPNTPGGPHTGANDLQNYPVLTSAGTSATATGVTGSLNSAAGTAYRLDFFGSPGVDATGHGPGRVYLGATATTTDGSGNATFNALLTTPIPLGWYVSATATDPNGNTSEFSADVPVATLSVGLITTLAASADPVSVGDTVTYTVTVTNVGTDPAPGVVVTDTLPSGLSYKSSTASQGSVSASGPTVTGTLGTLAGGASATVTITAQAASTGTFRDSANATSTAGVSGSASATTHVVLRVPVVNVTPSITSPVYGQTPAFTATVAAPGAGQSAPTGTVSFYLDAIALGPAVTLVNGSATSPPAPVLGAGPHTIAVYYSGDSSFSPASPAPATFTVAKAHLTVTANNQSRGQNVANPRLTYTLSGFVNGDNASIVTGQPALSTTAVPGSPPGAYPISVGAGTLHATNYDFANLVNGTLTVRPETPLDFDGSGHAEIGYFWPANAQWFAIGAQGGFSVGTFGAPNLTDIPVAGDYDGIGRTEMAVFRPSTAQWYAYNPVTGQGHLVGTFGAPNLSDIPVPGDYDGVGHTELAVFRPSTSQWIVRDPSAPGGARVLGTFGAPNLTDIPVPGDYDGVGHTELAVFRPSTGQWFVLGPSGGHLVGTFGAPNLLDVPTPGDYDGVGHTELAVFRPSTGQWFVLGPTGGRLLGISGVAVPGDIPAGSPAGSLINLGLLHRPHAARASGATGPRATSVSPVAAATTWDIVPTAPDSAGPAKRKTLSLWAAALEALAAEGGGPMDRV